MTEQVFYGVVTQWDSYADKPLSEFDPANPPRGPLLHEGVLHTSFEKALERGRALTRYG